MSNLACGLAPADVVLVRGDPTSDITATRNIVGVWKAGVSVDRQAYRASKELLRSAAAGPAPLLLHDFESEDPTPRFGSMTIQTDLHGPWTPPPSGGSTATWEQVSDGANGSERSLRVTGEIVPGHESVVNHPRWSGEYAGIAFGPIAPMLRGITLDFSNKSEITFWAKGANRAYSLILFQRFFGPPAGEASFTAGPQWSQFSIPLSDFTNLDPSSIRWIVFSGPSEPGAFSFLVDQVVVR